MVGLTNEPLMFTAFVPIVPPVNPPVTTGALQLYKVPAGTTPFVPLVGVRLKVAPLQIVAVIKLTVATGVIVTVTVNAGLEVQLNGVGVTI